MGKKFNIRCSIANYADNIQDGSERLGDVLIQRHFVDVEVQMTNEVSIIYNCYLSQVMWRS